MRIIDPFPDDTAIADQEDRMRRAVKAINSDISIRCLDERLANLLAKATPSYVFTESGQLLEVRYSPGTQELIDQIQKMKRKLQDNILRAHGLRFAEEATSVER